MADAALSIATWNVNSIRVRAGLVRDWLAANAPDLLLLQEIKCEAGDFPAAGFADLGYAATVVGQKAYNGVAILSRVPVETRLTRLPGAEATDMQARYLEVTAAGLVVGNLYLPNGNSGGADGYAYKLAWMERLCQRARALLAEEVAFVLAGDWNVCPTDEDYAQGALSPGDALIRAETRAAFRSMLWLGLTDALRAVRPHGAAYTFWDYQAGAWQRDLGLRIDHALLSPSAAERLADVRIGRDERDRERASDHVPVLIGLSGC